MKYVFRLALTAWLIYEIVCNHFGNVPAIVVALSLSVLGFAFIDDANFKRRQKKTASRAA